MIGIIVTFLAIILGEGTNLDEVLYHEFERFGKYLIRPKLEFREKFVQ